MLQGRSDLSGKHRSQMSPVHRRPHPLRPPGGRRPPRARPPWAGRLVPMSEATPAPRRRAGNRLRQGEGRPGFVARITSPATGAPDSMRNSAWAISGSSPATASTSLDVGAGVTVAAVQLQTVVGIRLASDRVLEREHQEPIRAQRSRGGGEDAFADRRNTRACRPTRSGRRLRGCRAGTPSARLSPVRRRRSSPSREPAFPRRDRRPPVGAHRGPPAGRRVPFRSRRPAHRGASTARDPNPPAWPPRAPGRGTTTARASIRSWRQNCRRFSRRIRSTRAPARLDPCRPPACAARSGPPALRRAILRRSSRPRRSRPACSAPAPGAFALPGASA